MVSYYPNPAVLFSYVALNGKLLNGYTWWTKKNRALAVMYFRAHFPWITNYSCGWC